MVGLSFFLLDCALLCFVGTLETHSLIVSFLWAPAREKREGLCFSRPVVSVALLTLLVLTGHIREWDRPKEGDGSSTAGSGL